MALGIHLVVIVALSLTSSVWALDVSAATPTIMNTLDLKNAMYTKLQPGSDACIRLLHSSGFVGCAAPSAALLSGPITTVSATTPVADIPQGAVALIPADQAGDFLLRCSTDTSLQQRLYGVLIEHSDEFPGWNEAPAAPYPSYATHATQRDYTWNPPGLGLTSLSFPFPIFQLDNVTSPNAQLRAQYNTETSNRAVNVARMELSMEGTGNSSACITAKTCYPLGGNSIWSALPPIAPSSPENNISNSSPPIIVVVAQIDSTALFHRLIQAADSPLSGLIAMLAAAEILGSEANSAAVVEKYSRRVVFLAVMGEPWDFMGSRRLLWEMEQGSSSVDGLSLDAVEGLIEIGQIGKAQRQGQSIASAFPRVNGNSSGTYQLYAHTEKTGAAAVAARPLQAALEAVSFAGSEIVLSNASTTTPGLPPSTASSLLRQRPDLAAVVIEEFDTEFLNGPYHSQYDTVERIDPEAIVATAIFVARAVHALALGSELSTSLDAPVLEVNVTAVRESVGSLLGCLAEESPGMGCPLVTRLMSPLDPGPALHYVGILRTTTEDPQTADANVQSDVERFIWNFLATATAQNYSNPITPLPRCRPTNATLCPSGTICAGYKDAKGYAGTGVCINSTTRFVPAYSTALECVGCNGTDTYYDFNWAVSDAATSWSEQYGWPSDPMWTESNWPTTTPSLVMYLKESSKVEYAVLAAGLSATVCSIVAASAVRLAWNKRLKQD